MTILADTHFSRDMRQIITGLETASVNEGLSPEIFWWFLLVTSAWNLNRHIEDRDTVAKLTNLATKFGTDH